MFIPGVGTSDTPCHGTRFQIIIFESIICSVSEIFLIPGVCTSKLLYLMYQEPYVGFLNLPKIISKDSKGHEAKD